MNEYSNTGIEGLDEVLQRLDEAIAEIEGRTAAGMLEALIDLRADMEVTPPVIPLDTGNLRASWFLEPIEMDKLIAVVFGFHADYAAYVHEMIDGGGRGKNMDWEKELNRKGDGKINWSKEGSGPKFLEEALKRNIDKMLKTIADNAQIQ
jgi:hypothetical protein